MSGYALGRPLLHVNAPIADLLDGSGIAIKVTSAVVTVYSADTCELSCGDFHGVLEHDPGEPGSAFRAGERALVNVEVSLGPGSQSGPGYVFFLIRG